MVGVAQVKVGEDGGFLKNFKRSEHKRQGITVTDSDFIETPVIDTGAKSIIFFFPQRKKPAPPGEVDDRMQVGRAGRSKITRQTTIQANHNTGKISISCGSLFQ